MLLRTTASLVLASFAAGQTPPATPPAAPSQELAEIAAAYAAKTVASAIFVSQRTLDAVLAEELAPTRPLEAMIRPLLKFDVNRERSTVTCRVGTASATAARTRNLGCTLVRPDAPLAALRERGHPALADQRVDPMNFDFPLGDRLPTTPPPGIDVAAVQRAVAAAFAEPAKMHTRAVVVVHKGRLVAEQYADGISPTMPLPGWSMTKTMAHALLGARVQQGKLDAKQALTVPEWQGDERRAIGFDDLLSMSAGLQWTEDYADPKSDALRMLFASSDHAAAYAASARAAAPGTRFVYASGATNLLCRVLRQTFPEDGEYWAFPRQGLFALIGMRTAVLETDPSGTFVGSSYGFACARDWARLGLLYLGDGAFEGRRILPPGWVAAARTPQPDSKGRYGRHLWLDVDPDGEGPQKREWPDLPANLFYMSGYEGQFVVMMPDEQLVVVRLGCSKNGGFKLRALLAAVRAAIRK